MSRHLTLDELQSGLPDIRRAPADEGLLQAIVKTCEISPELGVHGDNWAKGCWKTLPDGSPHPDVQIAIMNSRVIDLVAQRQKDRWPLAGDNLYVDLDISQKNLFCGRQLMLGSSVLEISDVAHNGCRKFAQRFGSDAVKFVNSATGKELRLRGVYAKVIHGGTISVGDTVRKLHT